MDADTGQGKKPDLTGRRYGMLLVTGRGTRPGADQYWACLCDCGGTIVQSTWRLRNRARCCGCTTWKAGCGELGGKYWRNLVRSAIRRGIDISISIEQAWQLFLDQGRRCAYSGVGLTMGKTVNKKHITGTASLDRIDSMLGYAPGNVQWVHREVNYMKMDIPHQEFIDWCRKIAAANKSEHSEVPDIIGVDSAARESECRSTANMTPASKGRPTAGRCRSKR